MWENFPFPENVLTRKLEGKALFYAVLFFYVLKFLRSRFALTFVIKNKIAFANEFAEKNTKKINEANSSREFP